MAKRQADHYLTHENWKEETIPEERGMIATANKDVIEQRQFKVAKRRIQDSANNAANPPSILSSFSFKPSSSQSTDSLNSNSTKGDIKSFNGTSQHGSNSHLANFNNISGSNFTTVNMNNGIKTTDSNSRQSKFENSAYLNKISNKEDYSFVNMNSFPSSYASSSSSSISQYDSRSDSVHAKSVQQFASFGSLPKASSSSSDSSSLNITKSHTLLYDGEETEYDKIMRKLNESVLKWVSHHLSLDPHCDLTPIFSDYERYIQKIDGEYNIHQLDIAKPKPTEVEKPATFKFGETSSFTKLHDKPNAREINATSPTFSFGHNELTSSSNSFIVDDSKNQQPQFNFGKTEVADGNKSLPPTVVKSTFTFDSQKDFTTTQSVKNAISSFGTSLPPPMGIFSFGASSSTQAAFSVTPTSSAFAVNLQSKSANENGKEENGGDAEEEEEDEPVKAAEPIQHEKDAFYSIRCKLYYLKGKEYKEKTLGTLYLKHLSPEKTQLIIRAENVNGTVMLNVILASHMAITQKNNSVTMVCIANPPMEKNASVGEPSTLLIRVKNLEAAEQLHSKLLNSLQA